MADLSITAANVLTSSGNPVQGIAGETITQGMSVYLKSTDSKWYKAQCDGTVDEAGATGFGVSLNSVLAGQPIVVQVDGKYAPGATVVVGTFYHISTTFGGICPFADLVSTNKNTCIGVGSTTSQIDLSFKKYTGYAVP